MNGSDRAFPVEEGQLSQNRGLTKREYIATHIMASNSRIWCDPKLLEPVSKVGKEAGVQAEVIVARMSVALADALIEALGQ